MTIILRSIKKKYAQETAQDIIFQILRLKNLGGRFHFENRLKFYNLLLFKKFPAESQAPRAVRKIDNMDIFQGSIANRGRTFGQVCRLGLSCIRRGHISFQDRYEAGKGPIGGLGLIFGILAGRYLLHLDPCAARAGTKNLPGLVGNLLRQGGRQRLVFTQDECESCIGIVNNRKSAVCVELSGFYAPRERSNRNICARELR